MSLVDRSSDEKKKSVLRIMCVSFHRIINKAQRIMLIE